MWQRRHGTMVTEASSYHAGVKRLKPYKLDVKLFVGDGDVEALATTRARQTIVICHRHSQVGTVMK
jgi:hypothetical protein